MREYDKFWITTNCLIHQNINQNLSFSSFYQMLQVISMVFPRYFHDFHDLQYTIYWWQTLHKLASPLYEEEENI